MYNEELFKLYEAYGLPYESYEDYVDRYMEDQANRKEYNELNRDDEYYSNVD